MAFVPFNNVAMVELFYRQDGQRLENVLHFLMTATPTSTTLNSLAGNVITWWDTVMQPLVSNTVQLVAVKATSLNSQSAPAVENVSGLPLVGATTTAELPNNNTLVIKFVTNSRGRSFRGRLYHVGLVLAQTAGNTATTAFRTAAASAYGALLVPGGFGGAQLVVASRYSNGVERSTGLATVVTGVSVNQTLDSQRRRLPERGL